jgi:hypothetical protein
MIKYVFLISIGTFIALLWKVVLGVSILVARFLEMVRS